MLALFKFLQIRKLIASIPKPQAQVVTAMRVQKQSWQPRETQRGPARSSRCAA
ncbi:MAG: hypothetical protein M9915_02970 [Rhizobacter sp.]|nr:hypothetical protein [Rhizobacter sp.]